MKREIKFRTWNNQKMNYEPKFGYSSSSSVNSFFSYYKEQPEIEEVLMQYTGLKDKNGKEIYEGDILHGREEGNGETTAWTDVYYIVFFKNGAFYVRENKIKEDSAWCDLLGDDNILNYYEIIGNIYENSELLTKTK